MKDLSKDIEEYCAAKKAEAEAARKAERPRTVYPDSPPAAPPEKVPTRVEPLPPPPTAASSPKAKDKSRFLRFKDLVSGRPLACVIGVALAWAFRWNYLATDRGQRVRVNRWTGTTERFYNGSWLGDGGFMDSVPPWVCVLVLAGFLTVVALALRRKNEDKD